MKGFFSQERADVKFSIMGNEVRKNKFRDKAVCTMVSCPCGLEKQCGSPYMEPSGEGGKGLLIIGEAPGKREDEQGVQFVGEAGETLRSALSIYCDIDLDKDCRKMNGVNCRPPNNRTPTMKEINCCRQRVFEEIERMKPKVILLLGSVALESFLGHRYSEGLGGVSQWRGFSIPDRQTGAWVVPTVHPSYVNRNKRQPVVETIFRKDLELAVKMLSIPFPKFVDERELVVFPKDLKKELQGLLEISKQREILLSFDFETSGLKPYAEGHYIRCMSMCWSEDYSISFLTPPQGSVEMELVRRILRSPRIKKTAHNIKFEDCWAKHVFGIQVKGWHLCTMLGSHVLDNRAGITGLKFQTYIRYGVIDYSSHIKRYLERERSKGFNCIDDVPERELLLYCGLDSLFQYRLAREQEAVLAL